jgi:hypothetical protein
MASQTETSNHVRLQQALTQAAVSQAQEAIMNAEAKSYKLQQQAAIQTAQLNEAESVIQSQQTAIEETSSISKRLRSTVSQQSAQTEAREQHISLLEVRLAEVNAENAKISFLTETQRSSYNKQMVDMESRIMDLERDLENSNTDLIEHKKLIKWEKADWKDLHEAMQATESRRAKCFGRMAEALSHLNELMSVVSDKINGVERSMTNPYPQDEVSAHGSPDHPTRAHVSPQFSIQELNLPGHSNTSAAQSARNISLPAVHSSVTKSDDRSNIPSAAQTARNNSPPVVHPPVTKSDDHSNTTSAAQPAMMRNEVTDSLETNSQPQTNKPPSPTPGSDFDRALHEYSLAEESFLRVDWYHDRGIPCDEMYELGVINHEIPMPDASENATPTNTEIINAPFGMAPGSGSGFGILSEETLTGIAGALELEEQRQTHFITPDSGAAPFVDAPTTTNYHQLSEVSIIDVTMTDAPAINLLPPCPHVRWGGVLDTTACAMNVPEKKRSRQVYGFWQPDSRSAESWDGNLYVKRTKLALPLSRPRYLNARKRWVKAVKSRVRALVPTTPAWIMPTVVSLSATLSSAPTQVDPTMAASTDSIVAPALINEQAAVASVLTEQAKAKEDESERPHGQRPRFNQGPGPCTPPVYEATSVPGPGALKVPVAPRCRPPQQSLFAKELAEIRRAQDRSDRLRRVKSVSSSAGARASAVVPGRLGFGLRDAHDNPRKIKGSRVEQPRVDSVSGHQVVDSGVYSPVSAPAAPVQIVAVVDSPMITFSGAIGQLMSLLLKFLFMVFFLVRKTCGYAMASFIILMAVLVPLVPVLVRFILTVMQALWQETREKAPGLVFSLAPILPVVSRALLVVHESVRRHCFNHLLLVLTVLAAIEYIAYSTQLMGYERQCISHLNHLRHSRFREWPWLEQIDFWVTRWLAGDRGTLG